ncbi:T9SS type A sorting domain-containing protein [candidate division KSB1 bacterium]|nr:T9SS type A sorting domain-containing protein [candidate division KSB1 bacterium]
MNSHAEVIFSLPDFLELEIIPDSITVFYQSEFEVNIYIQNVWQLSGFEFSILYPNELITYQESYLGTFLSSTGRSVGLNDALFTTGDQDSIRIAGFSFGEQDCPSGSDTLVVLKFRADATGVDSLFIQNSIVVNPIGQEYSDVHEENARIEIIIGVVDADLTQFFVEPNNVEADGISAAKATVIPKNNEGRLLGAGHIVSIQSTMEGTLIGTVKDEGNGSYTQLLSSINSGCATLSATVNNVNISNEPVVCFTAIPSLRPTSISYEITAGEDFWITVKIGSPSVPISGLASLDFDISFSDPSVVHYQGEIEAGSFFGDISEVDFDPIIQQGQIHISTGTLSGNASVNESGIIAELLFNTDLYTVDNTKIKFDILNVSAKDALDNPIILHAGTLECLVRGAVVWPGDANNDGIVNHIDFLYVGQAVNTSGPSRVEEGTEWKGYYATHWQPKTLTYIDANGNGIITREDSEASRDNWGEMHGSNKSDIIHYRESQQSIYLQIDQFNDNNLKLDLVSQNIDSIYGIAYRLQYTNSRMKLENIIISDYWGKHPYQIDHEDIDNNYNYHCIIKASDSENKNNSNLLFSYMFQSISELDHSIEVSVDEIIVITTTGEWISVKCDPWAVDGSNMSFPKTFALSQNYPNPFNNSTTIRYEVPERSMIKIQIFNLLGEKINTLISANHDPGFYSTTWNGENQDEHTVGSGLYYVRLFHGENSIVRKALFLK